MCQAGLFSAVTSAFIIQIDPQLRPDSGDDTAALLRILLYRMDNTTFGNEVPTLPQWSGPPSAMVHVQAILFASLSASLLSAFLAMLGKQWLNRYVSTDNRGSAIERCHNRQQKLDGIVAWYFDSVMESLPLMLQVALLLLGCALSRYLWETSMTVASVVIGVTSLGLLLYLFILVVGTVWESCPYQTPGSHFLRSMGPTVDSVLRPVASALGNMLKGSEVYNFITRIWDVWNFWYFWGGFIFNLLVMFLGTPIYFAIDVYHLVRVVVKALTSLLVQSSHLPRRVYLCSRRWFSQSTAAPDLRCASWTLQTFPNGPVRLSTLKYLLTSAEFTLLDYPLIGEYFDLLFGCISINNNKAEVIQGLEQHAMVYAKSFFHTLRRLVCTPPGLDVPRNLWENYQRFFPPSTVFRGLPLYHTMVKIEALINGHRVGNLVSWTDYRPSNQELIPFARHMVEAAQEEYQQTENKKLPCWILRFALHFLSLDPPAPASAIADCLTIIAIALDHNPSNASVSDERCIYSNFWEFTVLTKVQCTGGASFASHNSEARNHGNCARYGPCLLVQA